MTRDQHHGLRDRISDLHEENIAVLGDRDVVIASFGGAGQSLVGNILLELGLNYVDAYTERLSPDGTGRPVEEHAEWRRRLAASHTKDSAHASGRRPWPRFVKTHLPPGHFGDRPLLGSWILVRDPRDALYSRYRFRVDYAQDPADTAAGTFENWLHRPGPAGLKPVDDWNHFYDTWLDATAVHRRHTTTRFEDIKAAPSTTICRALREFGVMARPQQVAAAVERSSFTAMRAHEERNSGSESAPGRQQHIMRRGKPGEWREWMTPRLMTCFSAPRTRSVAARFGYRPAEA
ncbi:sulfotransferase domain-containing protein [Streptomyces sp. DT24]|uniref:sulfotransferase domain-containing protein n=1 Tax=unclassified Streptomyces TaxID=2593676 RepID=UPI0023B9BBFA|nr:sulfotransferase domain-containing protein [Streptomyces sp. AM 4-1-1]WEH34273.1 sulfotransferase domain-containing protein [Streptomyces sp. AM 4-1-1]